MYLLLVDQGFITSADLKEMIEKSPAGTDMVNSFSSATLLKLAEQVKPEIIIADLELVGDNPGDFFEQARNKGGKVHIISLTDAERYDELAKLIDAGGIDDYIIKPIHKDEFKTRVQLAARRFSRLAAQPYEPEIEEREFVVFPTGQTGEEEITELSDHFSLEEEPAPEIIDENFVVTDDETADDKPEEEADLFAEVDDSAEEEPVQEEALDEEEDTDLLFGDFDSFDPQPGGTKVQTPDAKADQAPASDFFDTDFSEATEEGSILPAETDQQPADQEIPAVTEQTSETESFFDDDFQSAAGEDSETETLKEAEPEFESSDSDDLFGQTEKEEIRLEEKTSFDSTDDLFDTTPALQSTEVALPADDKSLFEATADEEFDFKDEEPDLTDDLYFDDLFDDQAPETKGSADEPADDFDLFDEDPALPVAQDPTVTRKSPFPGQSADDFLFGESDEADFDQVPETVKRYVVDQKEQKKKVQEDEFDDFLDQFDLDETDTAVGTFNEQPVQKSEQRQKPVKAGKKEKSGGLNKAANIIGNVIFALLLLMMATLSIFLIQSRISGGAPQVAGYQMYIVLSGSMNPEFDTGSLAFVKETPPEQIVVGDIITFRSSSGSDSLTTHRVVEVMREQGLQFVTRGDANNVNDPNPVPAENIVGRVTGSVPYLGYLFNFVQTRQGLILLIFVPGVLIIVYELGKILKYIKEGDNDKKGKRSKGPNYAAEDFD